MGEEAKVTLDLSGAFIKAYNLQPQGDHCEITVPKHLLDREARIQGMTPVEYMENFEAVSHYGSFPGVYIIFQRKSEKEESPSQG